MHETRGRVSTTYEICTGAPLTSHSLFQTTPHLKRLTVHCTLPRSEMPALYKSQCSEFEALTYLTVRRQNSATFLTTATSSSNYGYNGERRFCADRGRPANVRASAHARSMFGGASATAVCRASLIFTCTQQRPPPKHELLRVIFLRQPKRGWLFFCAYFTVHAKFPLYIYGCDILREGRRVRT